MDPLSIIASSIALATAASQIGTAINRLRHFGEVPGKIYALKNEISDLEVVLRQVGFALEQNVLASNDSHASLNKLLGRTKGHLGDLTKALERIANVCSQRRIKVISKSTIWYTEKAVFQGFRDDIASVKQSLSLILSAAHSEHMKVIFLELRKVTVEGSKSEQSAEAINRGLNDKHTALTTHIDRQHESLLQRVEALGNILSKQQLRGADATQLQDLSDVSKSEGETVRLVASHRQPCRNWCPCVCHTRRKLKLASPGMMEGILGRLFIGYSGMPLQKEACDFRGCQDKQNATATIEYWFPSWFVSMNIKLHLSNVPRAGPDIQLSTTRRVADSSQSITFAMQGNIDGLRDLFTQGLAGPRDVSNSRGYTLLRWALYGGMHNHRTVQFLLREGAIVDEESYANVWDFVFRGKCTEEQQGALRCITDGGEGDWVEEQNFPLVHRIIFGLSSKLLAAELEENPRAIYLTDTQNRTALDWATARSQLEDMDLLIRQGADVNNMDITGRTPVLHAVDTHDADTLRAVLKAGGDPNPIYPKGMFRSSPLTAAGFAGMRELLKLLLDFEADPNACNPEGLTALHSVARTHNTDCAFLLLEYGADLNAMSTQGQTPMTVAIMHNNHPVLRLFVDQCYEYMTTTRFNGPEMLLVIAEHADVESMEILASVHPLKFSYDVSWQKLNSNREVLEKRPDYDDKLGNAFEELIAVVRAEVEETRSAESVLESGFFISARSSFRSDLADAISTLGSIEASPVGSDNSDEDWEDSREQPRSPTSPSSSENSPTSPTFRDRFRAPPATRDRTQNLTTSSPLRRELSR